MKYMLLIHQGDTPDPARPGGLGRALRGRAAGRLRRLPGAQPDAGRHARRAAGAARDGHDRPRAGRPDAHHRRPVRGDQGGARRLPALRGRRPRRRDRARRAHPGGPHGRRRSRSGRSRSGSDPRAGLPRPLGPRAGLADRLPRRLRPRRGGRPGGVRDRRRALAARRRAGQPGRLADRDRAQPRDRPHPPRPHARREDAAARACPRPWSDDVDDDDLPRRAARARLHLLSPGARHRGAGRAHAAHARRPDHGRDRARVPRPRGDDGAAAGARQAQDQGGRHPVPRAARPPAAGPAGGRARRRLPDLQRGLQRAAASSRPRRSGSAARSPS